MTKNKSNLNISKIENSILNGQSWLMNSGIQNKNKQKRLNGSVNAWFNPDKKKYSFVYSEINGYFLTMMVNLYKITNKKIYLKNALLSANWLTHFAQLEQGGFRCLFLIDKNIQHAHKENLTFSFDNGVILSGLCSLYKITKKTFLLNSAKKCADWLVNQCVDKNFNVRPVYDILDKKFYESDKEWSTISGSYHTKVAIGLLNYYSITKISKFKKFANEICKKSLEYQTKNGRFKSFTKRGGTNAHPHCYSAEGLWSVGGVLKNNKFLHSSYKATKWILSKKNKQGNIPRLFLDNYPNYNERVDAIAQVIRLNFLHVRNKKKKFTTE